MLKILAVLSKMSASPPEMLDTKHLMFDKEQNVYEKSAMFCSFRLRTDFQINPLTQMMFVHYKPK